MFLFGGSNIREENWFMYKFNIATSTWEIEEDLRDS